MAILHHLDNATAIAFLNAMGGTLSTLLCSLTVHIKVVPTQEYSDRCRSNVSQNYRTSGQIVGNPGWCETKRLDTPQWDIFGAG